jgi:pimeloyl-ACP methyl ester carboxylesterase
MTIAFDEFELDSAKRELRVEGRVRVLQPRVFDLLLYLVENHERVVPKSELLDTLWPDSIVTESSIQRAVSLARSALGERGAALIQTFPRQGYRFVGRIRMSDKPDANRSLKPRYARSGDVHIAYTTSGEGATDIVIVLGWVLPMRAMFKHPKTRAAIEALSEIGRVILFDKRGTGLSDRVKEVPIHEQRMDDLRAVLDACGSNRAIVIGFSEGGALAMLYAATYPERVRGLVLSGAFARMVRTPDYPYGYTREEVEKLKGYIRGAWGKGASLRAIAPSQLSDPDFVDWVAFSEQEGTSPGSALDLLEMNTRIDLRALLPAIRVPTVVLQAAQDAMSHPGNGPYLAESIPNAKYIEAPGDDHVFFFGAQHEISNAVRWILSGEARAVDEENRFLSTALVGRTAGPIDEEAWHALVRSFRGQAVPGKLWAYFDGPARAIRCGAAFAGQTPASFGVHTGEVVHTGASVSGSAFSIAETVAERAPPGEVWATQVLVDLVPGSDLQLEETKEQLQWQGREITLFSVRRQS